MLTIVSCEREEQSLVFLLIKEFSQPPGDAKPPECVYPSSMQEEADKLSSIPRMQNIPELAPSILIQRIPMVPFAFISLDKFFQKPEATLRVILRKPGCQLIKVPGIGWCFNGRILFKAAPSKVGQGGPQGPIAVYPRT